MTRHQGLRKSPEVHSRIYLDVAATFVRKEQMLPCHESSIAFLSAQQGIPCILDMVPPMAKRAVERAGFPRAEGFRQHLGQRFP